MTERHIIINVHRSSCKVPVTLFRFQRNFIFLGRFSKNIKFHENLSRVRRVVPCGGTDGRTDMTKLIVALRNCAKGPRNKKLNEGENALRATIDSQALLDLLTSQVT